MNLSKYNKPIIPREVNWIIVGVGFMLLVFYANMHLWWDVAGAIIIIGCNVFMAVIKK